MLLPFIPYLSMIDNIVLYSLIALSGMSTLIGIKKDEINIPKLKPIENNRREKMMKNALDKVQELKHESNYTMFGVDYDKLEKAQIEDKAKHILVAGTTGAGKTVTIYNFIQSAMQKQYPIFAIDGKGDLQKGSLLHYMQAFSQKYNRKLYVINLVKPECSDLYNPFRNTGRTEAKDMLISMN